MNRPPTPPRKPPSWIPRVWRRRDAALQERVQVPEKVEPPVNYGAVGDVELSESDKVK